jgi:hypothetical protein
MNVMNTHHSRKRELLTTVTDLTVDEESQIMEDEAVRSGKMKIAKSELELCLVNYAEKNRNVQLALMRALISRLM